MTVTGTPYYMAAGRLNLSIIEEGYFILKTLQRPSSPILKINNFLYIDSANNKFIDVKIRYYTLNKD